MPNGPIGSKKMRIRKAIYWYWTKDLTQAEIGEKLGVSGEKVSEYVRESPQAEAVQEQMTNLETEVRFVAVEKLRNQLREAGSRAASAEEPVKIWRDDDGNIAVNDKLDKYGNVVDRYPIPQGFEMGVDEQGRFYGRNEVREILDLLTDIVGAKAADRQEIEHSGGIETDFSLPKSDKQALDKAFSVDDTNGADS